MLKAPRRIAFVGLQTTHAESDARNLERLAPDARMAFIDRDVGRCAAFAAAHPLAEQMATMDDLLRWLPHGAVVTERPAAVAATVERLLALRIPVFANKPAAVTHEEVDALEAAVAIAPERFLTTSVLRFSDAVESARRDRRFEGAGAVRIAVDHDVSWWSTPQSSWQQVPRTGGGLVGAMGLHGIELAAALIGPGLTVTAASERPAASDRGVSARIALAWPDGRTGIVDVRDIPDEAYRVDAGTAGLVLHPGGAPDARLGYRSTLSRFLAMVEGAPTPVPWAESSAVLAAVANAIELAGRGAPGLREPS